MIFRYNSFFDSRAVMSPATLTARNGYLLDNEAHIIAAMDMAVIPDHDRWIPYKYDPLVEGRGIIWGGRVYWMATMCDELGSWKRRGFLDDYGESVFIDLMSYLFLDVYAWDMTYCFPCVKNEARGGLDTGSIISFLEQFDSDPFNPEVIDDSHSIGTWSLSDMTPDWLDEPVDALFLWEFNMDEARDM